MTYWGVLEEGALAADADYIVSGDKQLLGLTSYGNIKRSMPQNSLNWWVSIKERSLFGDPCRHKSRLS
ncbi:MAG: hypothetical protein AAB275_06460 [Deltaproteobacteria bacterium]